MTVEKDINGVPFLYENKDELVFEPDPNQLEPDEVDDTTKQESVVDFIGL